MEVPPSLTSAEEVWTSLFEQLSERIGPCFARSETREGVKAYLRGLLSPVERKNGWQLAEEAGLPTPYAMQYLLNRAVWESDEVLHVLQAYVREMRLTRFWGEPKRGSWVREVTSKEMKKREKIDKSVIERIYQKMMILSIHTVIFFFSLLFKLKWTEIT